MLINAVRTGFITLLLMSSLSTFAASSVSIKIEGKPEPLDKVMASNVRAYLSLSQQKDHARLTDSWIANLHKKAPQEIRKSLQALGYYKPEINSELTQAEEGWVATYTINPGPQLKISDSLIEIHGEAKSDPMFSELLADMPIKVGDPLHHGNYESAKKSIQRLAARRGYFTAQMLEHEVKVDLDAYEARLRLIFDSGERYKFGAINFSDSPIREESLREYLDFESGDPYSTSDLVNLQQTLSNTDYFDNVIVTPSRDSNPETQSQNVPIDVTLTPRKRNRYTAGVGFGTDTGPRIKLGWQNRYINRRGHRAGADIKLSPVLSSASTYYTIPHFNKRDAELGFSSSFIREDTDTSKSNAINIGANYRHKRWGWDETATLNYLYESFEISDQDETTKLLIPGIGWSKTDADNPTYTLNGYRINMNIRGAVETFLSDISFVQASVNAKVIRSFWENGRILVRGDLGITETSEFDRLPTSLRYFAGGDNSIRGFGYEDLGPRDEDGDVIGGKYLAVASVEYEHRIKEKWSVAGFVDAGNAFNSFSGDIEYGAGFGVRWLSPVGLIRVDLAMGLSEPDHPVRLHIVIGPDL